MLQAVKLLQYLVKSRSTFLTARHSLGMCEGEWRGMMSCGGRCEQWHVYACDLLLVCCSHSTRNTFHMLKGGEVGEGYTLAQGLRW